MLENEERHASPAYVYEPLDLSQSCLRVIRILPGPIGSPVECTLRTVELAHTYRALSYTWGRPSTTSILVNGYEVKVRENLHAFLTQARSLGIQHELFIDAICIDQSNTVERNHQVRHMAAIYRGADLVYLWPTSSLSQRSATGTDKSDLASSGAIPRSCRREVQALCSKLALLSKACEPHHVRSVMESLSHEDWHHLISLCEAPYWTRLWVCQEIVLAREIRLLFGADIIDWTGLSKLAEYAHVAADLHYDIPSWAREGPWSRISRFQKTSSLPSSTLLELTQTLGPMQCEDARDRVYGLLGLAADGSRLTIDYTETLSFLCLRFIELYGHGQPDIWDHLPAYMGITPINTEAFISQYFGFHDGESGTTDVSYRQVRLIAKFDGCDVYSLAKDPCAHFFAHQLHSFSRSTCTTCGKGANHFQHAKYLFDLRDIPRSLEEVRLHCGGTIIKVLPPDLVVIRNPKPSWGTCLICDSSSESQERRGAFYSEVEGVGLSSRTDGQCADNDGPPRTQPPGISQETTSR